MLREHVLIPSQSMGRRMHLWRFGSFGAPVLVFPSAAGMAHEWDAHGMVDALSELINHGRIKLYCTESNVAEAWTRKDSDPHWRIQRHQAYEHFVAHELAPLIREDCNTPDIPIATSGTSLGAFYAANFCLKYPETFNYALCMSGRYDTSWLTDGFQNTDVYFNNPMAYVPNLHGEHLDKILRHVHITLVCGQGKWEDGNIEDTQAFADALESKEISHDRDLWGADVSHQWPWWKRQALYHLGRRFGQ